MRKGSTTRKTRETEVEVEVNLDGSGRASIATGIGFLDHMLDLLARHSRVDIVVKAKGDLQDVHARFLNPGPALRHDRVQLTFEIAG